MSKKVRPRRASCPINYPKSLIKEAKIAALLNTPAALAKIAEAMRKGIP